MGCHGNHAFHIDLTYLFFQCNFFFGIQGVPLNNLACIRKWHRSALEHAIGVQVSSNYQLPQVCSIYAIFPQFKCFKHFHEYANDIIFI